MHKAQGSSRFKSLIDTGADFTMLNMGYAKQLDIEARKGIKSQTKGIEGGS